MAADIIEAWQEIEEASDYLSLDHKVHFDPRSFASDNPAPTREEFELNEEERYQWGCKCTQLRERMNGALDRQREDQQVV